MILADRGILVYIYGNRNKERPAGGDSRHAADKHELDVGHRLPTDGSIIIDGLEVRLPGRSDPITMGVTSGYGFFGGHAVYVEGFAQDSYCSNTICSLTDKEAIKHVGDVQNFRT